MPYFLAFRRIYHIVPHMYTTGLIIHVINVIIESENALQIRFHFIQAIFKLLLLIKNFFSLKMNAILFLEQTLS